MVEFFKKILNGRLLIAFLMGISAGLPLLLTVTLMQAWAKDAGVSLKEIGLMSLIGIPYTVKFLWSPIFDRFTLPFFGRRRGWLFSIQIFLILSILGMGLTSPMNLTSFIIVAALITFFSASQDIVIDAYRREDLLENELGIGSSYYVYGYRVGMLIVSGGGMILSDYIEWKYVFFVMAACMSVGLITTYFCSEPKVFEAAPKNLRESVIDPFIDYLKRPSAITILIFILFYKIGDNLAASLTTPFYLDLGFTKTEIGTVVKLFGFWATMAGSILGGIVILKIGIKRALWIFGFLQMVSTLGFAVLAKVGNSLAALSSVIFFENLTAAMATAAFVGFMASITNKKFTATQYALLSSLMGVPRVFISASSGFLAESMGWFNFYIFCTLIAIPGLALLFKFAPPSKE